MKIIKIEKAGLNAKVYFEEEETVSFRCELLLKSGLRKGDVIDESLIEKLSRDNEKFLAKESAFNFLSRRMHSVKELETKLKKKKYSGNRTFLKKPEPIKLQTYLGVSGSRLIQSFYDTFISAYVYISEELQREMIFFLRLPSIIIRNGISFLSYFLYLLSNQPRYFYRNK